jgi:hypothetical protein
VARARSASTASAVVFTAVLALGAAIALRAEDAPPVSRGGVDLARPQAETVTLETVMARATAYVAMFVDKFSNVVTEERYSQIVRGPGRATGGGSTPSSMPSAPGGPLQFADRRVLRSDLIVIKDDTPFGWIVLRDVFEVDGKPVRGREERLTRLFAQPSVNARAQAIRIADESARYNIGPGIRTTNTPELSILFLQASLQPRFTFTLGSRERSMGERVWVVEYRERVRPTLVRGERDADLPASGRFWIDADTGRVVQTEINLRPTAARWTMTTIFQPDERLGIAVPAEMREYYQWWATEMTGTATYGRFRTFTVTTDERRRE